MLSVSMVMIVSSSNSALARCQLSPILKYIGLSLNPVQPFNPPSVLVFGALLVPISRRTSKRNRAASSFNQASDKFPVKSGPTLVLPASNKLKRQVSLGCEVKIRGLTSVSQATAPLTDA